MTKLSNQRGITLLETVVSLAIVVIISGPLALTIHQVVASTRLSSDITTAYRDFEITSTWMGRDTTMAASTDLVNDAPAVGAMSLSWTEDFGEVATPHNSSYYLSGTSLQRDYDGDVITVGRNITDVNFSISNGLLTLVLTSSPQRSGKVSEQGTYFFDLNLLEE